MEVYPHITEKIKNLIDERAHGSVRKFSKMIHLSSSQKLNRLFNIDKRNNKYPEPSLDIILCISNAFGDVDLNWLLKGQDWTPIKKYNRLYEKNGVPYYDDIFSVSPSKDKQGPLYYIDCEPFNDCDLFVPYNGNSMKGAIESGDILALKRTENFTCLIYGETYLIVTKPESNGLVTVSTIRRHSSDDYLTLQPYNRDYDEMELLIDQIEELFIVKGRISRK
jgi:peptidase S24-like protein